jgi:hypothetical protein|tara:strand:+ start:5538 stop:6242 length:705 start_codon:yes stop_codon:yes gene_type:complete
VNSTLVLTFATALFIIYASSESLANIARHAGSKTKHYSLGLMLSNQVYSVNRINGFLIAPLLGLYVDSGGGEELLKLYAMIGCVASAVLLSGVFRVWPFLLRLGANLLSGIERNGFSFESVKGIISGGREGLYDFASKDRDLIVIFAQGLITSLAMPTAFILNILAIRYPAYQATLVQSATVISGAGNLLLNFYIVPKLALAETRGTPDGLYFSIMVGKIFGIGVMATCLILII